ncbi:MAG: tetratricopeptide repeat protein [Candidatus Poribacteria bacterium]|nr:tetratricopeptide repeat protein [Candidatus Poribacteria bacterium]
MRLRRFTLIFLLGTTCLSVANAEKPRDYYSPENVRKFADFLYEQGDYLRAASEYQRYLFYQPGESDQIHYQIGLCYRLGGKSEKAIRTFETFLHTYSDSQLIYSAHYQIGVAYFLTEQFQQSVNYLDAALPHITDLSSRTVSQELIGLSYLMQKRWLEAGKIFDGLQESEVAEVRENAALYHNYAMRGTQLPSRSPFLAGILSTIVPGAGRLYTGRIGDALTSLFTVGLTGWQAYDGFRRDGFSSAKGWGFGALSGIFYAGNIYGSVISARMYNRHAADEFLGSLSIKLLY